MNSQKSIKKTDSNQNPANGAEQTAEVLYQRLGNKWYAFSLIGNDVFVGALPPETNEAEETLTRTEKKVRRIRSGSA